ncbi:MAG TPA: hypothetical protein VIJ33_01440 [Solirubrobacteraceae bacterium]
MEHDGPRTARFVSTGEDRHTRTGAASSHNTSLNIGGTGRSGTLAAATCPEALLCVMKIMSEGVRLSV